ncbi:MAG: TlpA family protein disulfide reductase [Candidatus Amulumruptor caecigallinarius]|nr:TlpA family protein disulfide reductase [Candidatus Amulumruptor caecigallinarius]
MKTAFVIALAAFAGINSAQADITVNVAPATGMRVFNVEYGYLDDMVKPRSERPQAKKLQATVNDIGQFKLPEMPDGPAQYVIPTGDREYIVVYSRPGENLTLDILSKSPLNYTVSGSKLMEDISELDTRSGAILDRFNKLRQSENFTDEEVAAIQKEYNSLFLDYINADPESEAIPYAIMNLDGEDFLVAYNNMTPRAKASPIAIFLEPQKQYIDKKMEAERKLVQLQSGDVTAPNFTFPDITGKEISLSDFRGKWVIIDFWGSWCPWCIKGFPKLKEAYAKYKPQLEIVGVACSDPRDAWENALKKYELPWVNLYNSEQGGGKVIEEYAVEGFPTKVIVNPQGKIVNITSGDNPEFFVLLNKLLK